jgi:NADH-quinone oxidoreductase subunit L
VLVSGFIVGILLLTLGRKLFWLFVGGSGFVVAFFLTGELLPGQPTWVFLLVALVAGLLGAWLAVRLQWLAVGVGGFLGGGYIAAVFVESLNLSLGGPEWLPVLLWVIAFLAAGMTAFYVFRAVFLTFHGEDRVSEEAKHHLHESPPSMTMPLVVLAAGAVVVGFLGVPQVLGGSNLFHEFLAPVFGGGHGGGSGVEHSLGAIANSTIAASGESTAGHTTEIVLMVLSVLIGLAGILTAVVLYLRKPEIPGKITRKLGGFYTLVYNKYFVDEVYERTLVRPGYWISDKLFFKFVDTGIIEGIVNGLGITARLVGATVRLAQSGVVRTYAFFFLIGFLFILYRLVF